MMTHVAAFSHYRLVWSRRFLKYSSSGTLCMLIFFNCRREHDPFVEKLLNIYFIGLIILEKCANRSTQKSFFFHLASDRFLSVSVFAPQDFFQNIFDKSKLIKSSKYMKESMNTTFLRNVPYHIQWQIWLMRNIFYGNQ